MTTQIISYDLRQPGRNYEPLYEAIQALGSWWHCLESVWIVDTSLSATGVRNTLGDHIDSNDKLLVCELTGTWATRGITDECTTWLAEHVSRTRAAR